MQPKCCELNVIQPTLLKKLIPCIIKPITHLINTSFSSGVFAANWKTAIIRPLLKKPSLDLKTKNYRPVSNLSFLSKLLEKCALVRFNNHCKENNLMPSHQSAYREHHSCEIALVRLTNDLLCSMENQWVTALVAIDLSVAFDKVDLTVLLKVLQQNFGVNGKVLNWIDTCLRPRGFKVNIGKEYSKYIPMDFSVPQGSILGPVLFSAYISTLRLEVPRSIDLIGFADDHVLKKDFLASKGNKEDNTIYQLQNCCMKVKNWMDHNRLKMNSDKTEFIMIGSKQQLQKCYTKQFNINSENIIMSETIKYLGAWIDSSLSFKKHITERCKMQCGIYTDLNILESSLIKKHVILWYVGWFWHTWSMPMQS